MHARMHITIAFKSKSLATFTAFVPFFSNLRNGIEVNIELSFSLNDYNCRLTQYSTHMNQHMHFQTRSRWNDEFAFGAIEMHFPRMQFFVLAERHLINEFHATMIALQWLFPFALLFRRKEKVEPIKVLGTMSSVPLLLRKDLSKFTLT